MSIKKSTSNECRFILNILEISGKNIVNTYINNVKQRIEDHNLKYKIDIITDEQFYTLSREQIMYGGSNSTFPYKHFESAFNKITNTFKNNNNTTNKKISSSEIKVDPEESQETNTENTIIPNIEIVDRMMTYKPVELKEKSNKKLLDKSNEVLLDIPVDYNGIIHISLIIYNSYDYVLSGGITQLNTFLETYNKLN
tara:strand:+ start:8966 stop:9556 length:591 start_codon:yes stop_codon:yes gene_type:complete